MVSGPACVLGFNLNMRATNSLITAGLGPVGVWTQGNLGQFKCSERGSTPQRPWKCLSRRRLWGTMTFPSRDDVSQAFCVSVCVSVCVCVFFRSRSGQRRERHRKSMVWPSVRASETLSTDTTVSVGDRFVEARQDYLHCGFSQSYSNKRPAE